MEGWTSSVPGENFTCCILRFGPSPHLVLQGRPVNQYLIFYVQGCPSAFCGGMIQTKVRQVTVIVPILQESRLRHRET